MVLSWRLATAIMARSGVLIVLQLGQQRVCSLNNREPLLCPLFDAVLAGPVASQFQNTLGKPALMTKQIIDYAGRGKFIPGRVRLAGVWPRRAASRIQNLFQRGNKLPLYGERAFRCRWKCG